MQLDTRLQRVLIGFSSTFAAKGIGLACQLLMTAYVARAFSSEAFGIWAILLSIIILSPCFDFGLGGPVLRNYLTEAKEEGKLFYFSVTSLLFVIYGILALFLFSIAFLIPWHSFFHVDNALLNASLGRVFASALLLLALRIPFAMNADAFYGYHETHIRGVLDGIEVVLLSATAISLSYFKVSFLLFVQIYFLTYTLMSVLSFFIFLKRRGWVFEWKKPKEALKIVLPHRRASIFFWLQNMTALFLFSQLTSFVAHFTNAAEAGNFSLIFRLFSIALGVQFAFMNPLWGNYKEALLLKDSSWVKRALKSTLILTSLGFGSLTLLMVCFHSQIILIWTGKTIHAPYVVFFTGLWTLFYGLINCYSTLLNAMSRSGVQFALFALSLAILLVFSPLVSRWGLSSILALHCLVFCSLFLSLKFISLTKLDD